MGRHPPFHVALWQDLVDTIEAGFLDMWGIYLRWFGCYRVTPIAEGRLYRSTQMPPHKMAEVCRRVGVRTVIDLRRQVDWAEQEREALAEVGVRHVHLVSRQVPDDAVVARFLEIMDEPANHPVLIHCKHGIGRTGCLMAVYRMEYAGLDPESARREAKRIGGFQSFGVGRPKGDFILNYRPRQADA